MHLLSASSSSSECAQAICSNKSSLIFICSNLSEKAIRIVSFVSFCTNKKKVSIINYLLFFLLPSSISSLTSAAARSHTVLLCRRWLIVGFIIGWSDGNKGGVDRNNEKFIGTLTQSEQNQFMNCLFQTYLVCTYRACVFHLIFGNVARGEQINLRVIFHRQNDGKLVPL